MYIYLCSLTGRRCNQQGLGLSGLVHEKAHPVVPDISQSRLECIDAGCIHRPLVQQIPPINDLAWKKYLVLSLVHRVLTSLHVWPLVPLLFVSKIKGLWSEILLNPLYIHIFYHCITDIHSFLFAYICYLLVLKFKKHTNNGILDTGVTNQTE